MTAKPGERIYVVRCDKLQGLASAHGLTVYGCTVAGVNQVVISGGRPVVMRRLLNVLMGLMFTHGAHEYRLVRKVAKKGKK